LTSKTEISRDFIAVRKS